MPFKKGETTNPKGRPKGTPNKTTDELRGLFQLFIEANINDLQANYNQLEAKDKLNFVISLTKMILPAPLTELQRLTDEQLDLLIKKLKQDAK